MKKILIFIISIFIFLSLNKTFADVNYININTLPEYEEFISPVIDEYYFYYRGNYLDLGDHSGLYYYDSDYNWYRPVEYLQDKSPCQGTFDYGYNLYGNGESGLYCGNPGAMSFIPESLFYREIIPINGVCGTNSTSYDYDQAGYEGDFCSSGLPSPPTPAFPNEGQTITWSCVGIDGGTTINSCAAIRESSPPTPPQEKTLIDSINGLTGVTGSQTQNIILGQTGLLIGSIVALLIITIVIAYFRGWFKK